MLVKEDHRDLQTSTGPMRVYFYQPNLLEYPHAKFPARSYRQPRLDLSTGVVVFTEIYQVTGPLHRFCRQIASQGYVVACNESFHEFEVPGVVIPYDVEGAYIFGRGSYGSWGGWFRCLPTRPLTHANARIRPGTDRGNRYKVEKKLAAYDEDATLAIDALVAHPNCNGKIGATEWMSSLMISRAIIITIPYLAGMCLGGHLAFRMSPSNTFSPLPQAALDPRVLATVTYFATDIHSRTLGKNLHDDSLERSGEIRGELLMIFGKQDTHVPRAGRDLIRGTLEEKGVTFSWCEYQAQHAFIRDELSKGRYDAALSKVCFDSLLELFHRKLYLDLGARAGEAVAAEHIC
ncbi:Alpha/Beta hydrolase protein [Jimgerdemannia flammicorona]|uniref:Alpha/Beta hydrolase protein n=1 Tax=Jimgerdemannia flammicorona TaxID=994334 RepID=A0A433CXU7_9FUNG|nr:Alpha/Beta hydrolase protein [Jimgerdemannia flammicorona]